MAEIQEQEQLTKKIQDKLEHWRELIIPVYDVLQWRNIPLHPGIIFGVSTALLLLILILDLTVVSFVSSLLLCITILDYVTPIIISKIFHNDSWTGAKQKKLEEICQNIACDYLRKKSSIVHFYSMKDTRPKTYYAVLIFGLLFLSWIGNNVNNIFLTYLVVTYVLMLPGLKHNGYLKKYSDLLKQCLVQTVRGITSCKKEKKT